MATRDGTTKSRRHEDARRRITTETLRHREEPRVRTQTAHRARCDVCGRYPVACVAAALAVRSFSVSLCLWLSDELVPQAVDGEDVLGRSRVRFEFLA